MSTHVYDFTEGCEEGAELLGGKGDGLAAMTSLGLPVPPGFTITTEACRHHLRHGESPPGLHEEVDRHLAALERVMGRRLGDPDDPLLLSVRSGAPVSMPGMMDTVLDIGLNDHSVRGLAARAGDDRFALDSYRRLLVMFGETVLRVPSDVLADAIRPLFGKHGVSDAGDLDAPALQESCRLLREVVESNARRCFPEDPREQLALAINAVFDSWNSERAVVYRRLNGIPDDLGTAVTVQAMVVRQ